MCVMYFSPRFELRTYACSSTNGGALPITGKSNLADHKDYKESEWWTTHNIQLSQMSCAQLPVNKDDARFLRVPGKLFPVTTLPPTCSDERVRPRQICRRSRTGFPMPPGRASGSIWHTTRNHSKSNEVTNPVSPIQQDELPVAP